VVVEKDAHLLTSLHNSPEYQTLSGGYKTSQLRFFIGKGEKVIGLSLCNGIAGFQITSKLQL